MVMHRVAALERVEIAGMGGMPVVDHGIKLAFENCPMIFSYDEWPGGHNIAYSPQVWRRILETWGGDIGMR